MTSMGETLRRERLRRGWELKKVSAETKIGLHLLEAIEADQFDRLPGGVFAKSFIRQYAQLLGVDDAKIAAELKSRFDEPEPVPAPEPQHSALHLPRFPALNDFRDRLRSDSSIFAFVWLVAVILGCAVVYGFWQNRRSAKQEIASISLPAAPRAASDAPHRAAPQPDGLHESANAKEPGSVKDAGGERDRRGVKEAGARDSGRVAEPASLSKALPAIPPEPPKSDFRPAELTDSGTIKIPAAPARPAAQSEQATSSETSSPSQPTPAQAALRVAFTATERVWISIKSDGTRAFSGTLEARESKQFDAAQKISALVGNAGGVQINLNGKPVGSIGDPGQIQLLVLTPRGAHIVPRTPPISEVSPAPAAAEARP